MSCRRELSLALAILVQLPGCGSEPQAPHGIRVSVAGPDGLRPTHYRAILADTSGQVLGRVSCPGGAADGALACSLEGVAASTTGELTVKASGYTFQAVPISETGTSIALHALDAFDESADYRTGFDAQGGEAFRALAVLTETELGPAHSVKFYIHSIGNDPKVYFQNTRNKRLHYDFVRTVLQLPLTEPEFEATTYHGIDRTAMAGTLTWYPDLSVPSRSLESPIALTFFPSDDATPEQIRLAYRLLEERLLFSGIDGGSSRLVYLPAGSTQELQLAQDSASFTRYEALFATRHEIYADLSQQVLNPGLAYGILQRLSPEQLATTPVSFRDIVVLTRLPNDLPIVGGTITEELQTPLAHVNIAAHARSTPNLALLGAGNDPRILPLLGQMVRFEVRGGSFSLTPATLADAEAHWQSQRRPITMPEADLSRTDLPAFEQLQFQDYRSYGVKAANLGELRRLLGAKAPSGFAVPFSAYHDYVSANIVTAEACAALRADCETEQRSAGVCDRAARRCLPADTFSQAIDRVLTDAEVQSDSPLREACLDGLSYLIRHGTVDSGFAAKLDSRVAELFGASKVRLRSSTNSEDLVAFNGAGLYESVSAFASGDRRASAKIRDVWASVWRWKSFEERSFWNIDHRAVCMGVAVNQAYDDEVANGVLITQNIADPSTAGMYVNVQQGEVSVTNPAGGAIPEVFSIVPGPAGGVQVAAERMSSLSPYAALLSDTEVLELWLAASQVHQHFAMLYQEYPDAFSLDLEFKFHGPDRALVIKQARPYAAGD